jgi:hypothetical protein
MSLLTKGGSGGDGCQFQQSPLKICSCVPAAEPKSLFHVIDIQLQRILAGPLILLPWKF